MRWGDSVSNEGLRAGSSSWARVWNMTKQANTVSSVG